MARKRVKTWREDDTPPRRSPWRTAWRAGKTLLVLAVIAYVALVIAGQTDGFRDLVRHRLERQLGQAVKVEGASLSLRLDLTLRGVVSEGTKRKNSPGLRIQRAFIGWDWSQVFRRGRPGVRVLDLERCEVVFGRAEDGSWQPARMAPLSAFLSKWLELDLGSAAAPAVAGVPAAESATTPRSAALAFQQAGTRVILRGGQITWWVDESDVPFAAVEGVRLQATPVTVPGRHMTHYALSVERAASATGARVSDLKLEVLDAGDQQVILGLTGEHVPAPRSGGIRAPQG